MGRTRNYQLTQTRKDKGWTLEKASEHVGCAFQTLSEWERGSWIPSGYSMLMLARGYDKSIEDLFGKWLDTQ